MTDTVHVQKHIKIGAQLVLIYLPILVNTAMTMGQSVALSYDSGVMASQQARLSIVLK